MQSGPLQKILRLHKADLRKAVAASPWFEAVVASVGAANTQIWNIFRIHGFEACQQIGTLSGAKSEPAWAHFRIEVHPAAARD